MPRGSSVVLFERLRHEVEKKGKMKDWGSEGGKDWDWDA